MSLGDYNTVTLPMFLLPLANSKHRINFKIEDCIVNYRVVFVSQEERREFDWNRFLDTHKEAISEIIGGIAILMKETPKHKFRSMMAVFSLLGGIIIVISVLCGVGKISGEAVTFLIGTIIGYAFSFLHKYVIGI